MPAMHTATHNFVNCFMLCTLSETLQISLLYNKVGPIIGSWLCSGVLIDITYW
jgi:hypothetical protein